MAENKTKRMGIFDRVAVRTRTTSAASPVLGATFFGGMIAMMISGPVFPLAGMALIGASTAVLLGSMIADGVGGMHNTTEINRQTVVGKRAYLAEFKDAQADVYTFERKLKKAKTSSRKADLENKRDKAITYCEKLADKLTVLHDSVEPDNTKLRVFKSKQERKEHYRKPVQSIFDKKENKARKVAGTQPS